MPGLTGHLVGTHQGCIRRRYLVQARLCTAQDERQPVVLRRLREGAQPCLLEQGMELGHAVRAEQIHRWHIQRAGQRLTRRHGPVELPVKVLRRKAPEVHGNVRQQRPGQNHPLLQRRRIQKRLQDTPGTSCPCRHIHLHPRPLPVHAGIADISHHGPAGIVYHYRRHVGHALCRQVAGASVHGL